MILTRRSSSPRLRAGLAALGLGFALALATRSVLRCADWQDERSLWESAIAAGYDTWRARLGLGNDFLDRGQKSEAAVEFRQALGHRPLTVQVRRTLVGNLVLAGDLGSAAKECGDLLKVAPGIWDCNLLLAEAAHQEGDRKTALRYYRAVLASLPSDVEVLTKTAWLLATSPERELRNGAEARRLAESAYLLAPAKTPEILDTLSAAEAEAGDREAALRWGRQAHALALGEGRTLLAARIAERLTQLSPIPPVR